jgi:hypothetical protein
MKVLAWPVAERLEPATTRSILLEALENADLHDSKTSTVRSMA